VARPPAAHIGQVAKVAPGSPNLRAVADETQELSRAGGVSVLPAGTLTFLAAGSAPGGELGEVRLRAFEEAVSAHGGRRAEGHPGDGLVAAFESATGAVAAASELLPGPSLAELRLALHTGTARLRDDGRYAGAALRHCESLRDAASGGQALLTSATVAVAGEELPEGVSLRDLGVHRLRDLSRPERVFELRRADDGEESPPLRSLDAEPNNLPVQVTSFVGRRDELAAIRSLLAAERLVTLTGAGGSGKTRLAAQAAAEQAGRWHDGVWWVDLGAARDAALVAELVASATGVPVEPVHGPLRSLTVQLAERRLLLCLDNCEHLIDAAGEEAVRTMCARLDGMPLALELAAAWLRTLAPRQIEEGLDDRFALLVRGPRDAVPRQQTLAASMDWSHDLLDEPDRVVFRRLAVFAGPFDLDGAGDRLRRRTDPRHGRARCDRAARRQVAGGDRGAGWAGALPAARDDPGVRRRAPEGGGRDRSRARPKPRSLPRARRACRAGAGL
jgi:hypothetical protein